MPQRFRVSRLISIELDGVPPLNVSLEVEDSEGRRSHIDLDAATAGQLKAALLRIPLERRSRSRASGSGEPTLGVGR